MSSYNWLEFIDFYSQHMVGDFVGSYNPYFLSSFYGSYNSYAFSSFYGSYNSYAFSSFYGSYNLGYRAFFTFGFGSGFTLGSYSFGSSPDVESQTHNSAQQSLYHLSKDFEPLNMFGYGIELI